MTNLLRSHKLLAIAMGAVIPTAAFAFDIPDEQPYIYDYYNNGQTPAEYVAAYQGTAFKEHKLTAAADCKMEAEDFDNGGKDISWSFKNTGTNNYRTDITEVKINKGATGFVIGNVSGGDWLCYTINVEDAGEYELQVFVSSDNIQDFHFEIDGKSAGKILSSPGKGWDTYVKTVNPKLMLSAGKHVVKWKASSSMNIDYYVWHRTGEYVAGSESGVYNPTYPRTWKYTGNPMFTELDSPMNDSEFISPFYSADPSAHVWNIDGKDVLYLYASHDVAPTQGCDHMDRYHIFSTEDMINWTDHGEIMNATTSNTYTGTENSEPGKEFMWAPDCNYNKKNGLYYFIYPHKIKVENMGEKYDYDGVEVTENGWRHFLATSENPAGPFKCIGYIDGIPSTIDPCLFVDDDGKAYVFTSGNGGCWMTRLKDDNWLEADGRSVMLKPEGGKTEEWFKNFHEGPWMFKKDGKYYLTYADGYTSVNRMQYSVADNINGPYTPKGVFMNPMGCNTTHGSQVEFKGKWYTFYHTADFSGHGAKRSVCYDEQTFDAEGNLELIRNFGEVHGELKTFDGTTALTISAGDFNEGKGGNAYYKRDLQEPDRDSESIQLDQFEFLRYTLNVAKSGRYALTLNAENVVSKSQISIAYDGTYKTAEQGRKLPLENVIGEKQELYIFPISLEAGEHYIELRVQKGAMKIYDFTLAQGSAFVPGTIEAEDLNADDYLFKDENALTNYAFPYRDDVRVKIDTHNANGGGYHIGSVSNDDYYKYNFTAKEAGIYTITTCLSDDVKASSILALYIDEEKVDELSFSGKPASEGDNGWNNYFTLETKNVKLTEGNHVLKASVVRGPMNLDSFKFEKTAPLSSVDALETETLDGPCTVYSVDGRLVRKAADAKTALEGLDHGIYILNGHKVVL